MNKETKIKTRVAALIGPGDSGKTSLLESLLYNTGALERKGVAADYSRIGDRFAPGLSPEYRGSQTILTATSFLDEPWVFLDCPGAPEFMQEALNALIDWIFSVSDIPWLIATVDCANEASCKAALSCGFELYERRTPIHHKQYNMESDSYFYFRRYRPK